MALACPVCDSHQADAEHLANHLAITASLHGAEHEDWLAEHVPDWADRAPDELGASVREYAEEVEHAHEDDRPSEARPSIQNRPMGGPSSAPSATDRDPETERILERARAMTERMLDAEPDESDDVDGSE